MIALLEMLTAIFEYLNVSMKFYQSQILLVKAFCYAWFQLSYQSIKVSYVSMIVTTMNYPSFSASVMYK